MEKLSPTRKKKKKKSLEFFSENTGGCVLKGVPPDKSVGAWPSVQEKTTDIGNVGQSPCGGTDDTCTCKHQSLKVQENPRGHSVVANQEDIPTGERPGVAQVYTHFQGPV